MKQKLPHKQQKNKYFKLKEWLNNRKTYVKIFIITILFIFTVPFTVNFIIHLTSPLGFINNENIPTWVGFIGSAIGGAFTFSGVWWTIENDKQSKKDEKRIEYKPLLYASIDFNNGVFTDYHLTVPIILKNLGRGEAWNVDYEIQAKIKNLDNKHNSNLSINFQEQDLNLLIPGEEKQIVILFDSNEIKKKYKKISHIELDIKFTYYDLFRDIKLEDFSYNLSFDIEDGHVTNTTGLFVEFNEDYSVVKKMKLIKN